MATGDKLIIPAQAAGFYSLFGHLEKGDGDTLNTPEGMLNIGGNGFGFLLDAKIGWDPAANSDGSFSSLALGDDVYIYAVRDYSGLATLVASKNSTVPDGATADESRKLGGFHFGRVRPLSEAFNAAASLPVQIVPNSCWDLRHRPKCDPTGMAEIGPGGFWSFIYLASEDGAAWPNTRPVSRYDAVPLTGTEGYSRLDYSKRLLPNAGLRLPDYSECLALAYGVPQGAAGGSSRLNTGQHGPYGFECVSCLNIDQPSGNLWQQMSHYYDRRHDLDTWGDDLNTGKDSAHDQGQWRGGQFRTALFGGNWSDGAESGAGCVHLHNHPWHVTSFVGLRAVCDPL